MKYIPKLYIGDEQPFVFISYSHKDSDLVYYDMKVLEQYNVRFWFDFGIPPGKEWDKKVRSIIFKTNCIGAIFYFTTEAIASEAVHKELKFWYEKKYAQELIYKNGQNKEVASVSSQNHFAIMLDHNNFAMLLSDALSKGKEKVLDVISMIGEMFSSNKLFVIHPQVNRSRSMPEYYDEVLAGIDECGARDITQTRGSYRCVYNEYLEGSVIHPTDLGTESVRILPDILMGSHVVGIGDYAFENDQVLYEIKIPRGVRYIGKRAFAGCSNLFRITVPETVEEIGEQAFECCTSLLELRLPNNLRKLGNATFRNCTNLKSIFLPSKIEIIPAACFKYCHSLDKIDLTQSLMEIGVESFSHCEALKTVSFSPSIVRLGRQAFANCVSLQDVEIPSTLTEINEGAFEECTGLVRAVLQDCRATVARRMFANCYSLITIELSDSIGQIKESAFENCKKLQYIRLPKSLKQLDDRSFFQCEQLTTIELPNTLLSIGRLCFAGDSNLQMVKLPERLERIGSLAFANCSKIQFVLDSSVKHFFILDNGVLYTADGKEVVTTDATIPEEVHILKGVQIIRPGAFLGSTVHSIQLPDSLTDIGQYAFFGMPKLQQIALPDGVNRIGNGNFSGCRQLEWTSLPMGVKRLGGNLFRDCPRLTKVYYSATHGAQMGLCCFQSLPSMSKIVIKEGMKSKLVKMRGWSKAERWMEEQKE